MRAGPPPVRVRAPAKVNLALHVGPRRPDGYHDIDTLFQAIDLADELEVERSGAGIELTVEGEDAGPPAENLVVRAARAFFAVAGMRSTPGLRVRLRKRIPVGAGLGGGSSDAAAMLKALDQLFPDRIDPMELSDVAAGIGSDVPFFMGDSPLARGRGRGERLDRMTPLPAIPGVVVMPPAAVSTAAAYAALDRRRGGKAGAPRARPAASPRDWSGVAAAAANDFEEVVAGERPEVAAALAALRATDPLMALLSGSGAACFALYRTGEAAGRAAAAAERAGVGRILPFSTLQRWPEAEGAQP